MTVNLLRAAERGHRGRWLAGAAALSAVALVTGCSGGSNGSSAAAIPGPSAASAAPTTATASEPPSVSAQAPVPVEKNPPGDIPDNLAFVAYANAAGRYSFTHPEGWARTVTGVKVQFTDKLNSVTADALSQPAAPTVASARAADVPRLQRTIPAFELRGVTAVNVPGGKGVRIVFRRNSDPDAVTGRVYRDEVEEYEIWSHGQLVRLDLSGPVGADNVDAYRTMSRSLRIR